MELIKNSSKAFLKSEIDTPNVSSIISILKKILVLPSIAQIYFYFSMFYYVKLKSLHSVPLECFSFPKQKLIVCYKSYIIHKNFKSLSVVPSYLRIIKMLFYCHNRRNHFGFVLYSVCYHYFRSTSR